MNTDSQTPPHEMRPRVAWAIILVTVIFATTSCHHVFEVNEIKPPDLPVQIQKMVGAHGFSPDFLAACAQMGWSEMCDDPVYTDDQKLKNDVGGYGPHAYITPSTNLKLQRTSAAFATPQLVGFVFVDPKTVTGNLPQTYTDLWLASGVNCLFLQQTPGAFAAYVTNTSNCLAAA